MDARRANERPHKYWGSRVTSGRGASSRWWIANNHEENAMTPRLDLLTVKTPLVQLFIEFSHKVEAAGLEKSLLELVKIRASQINGCAVCLHMHTRDARRQGESEDRLYMLDAWRESPLYTARERAALAWTEALTLLSSSHAPDDVYALVKAAFCDEESIALTMLINVINGWNRLGVGYRRSHPGSAPATTAAA
jgi:AhpD family alkylhydroperoxidase